MKLAPKLLAACSVVAALGTSMPAMAGKVLDKVKQADQLVCGVHTGRAGFAQADGSGKWSGLDVDFCRAVAAAVLGDANKVKFVPTSGQTRITALQSGEIDLLARNTTFNFTRDTSLGLAWTGVNFYDGQAFIVKKRPNLKSAKQLDKATICIDAGTSTERNLQDYARNHKITFKTVVFDNAEGSKQAFTSGRCQAYTGDYTALAILRATDLPNPNDYELLPEIISKEPVGPAVRRGDEEWFTIVRWTLQAMQGAEELGLTQANIDAQGAKSDDIAIKRFAGNGDDIGKSLSLDKKWAYRIVKQVGNYGESFERNLGMGSSLKLERGMNRLYTKGGLVYPLPLQ
jgi:general L-amino acid transport system substrate-binding protein